MVTVIPSSGFNDWRIINHGATNHPFTIIATDLFVDEERTYLNRTNTTLISCPAINYTIVTQQNIIAAIKIGHGQNIILQWHGIERKHVNTIKEIQRRYKNNILNRAKRCKTLIISTFFKYALVGHQLNSAFYACFGLSVGVSPSFPMPLPRAAFATPRSR